MTQPLYRQLEVVEHTANWQQSLPVRCSSRLFLSDQSKTADAALSRYRDYLGHEFKHVIIDCRQQLHVDAIAALCGTVVAGGQLSLLVGEQRSVMLQRLINHWQPTPTALTASLPELPTAAQTAVLEQLTDTKTTHLLIADRGRGKSHIVGTAVKQLLAKADNQTSVLITAPRRANAKVLLNIADNATFVAWDKLLDSQPSDALLVIDEAAGIPLWATQKLCDKYTPWILATTVNGYEGCGRGFAVHFRDWVCKRYQRVKQHQLHQPIRWPEGDPLESWLSNALLLKPAPQTLPGPFENGVFHASELPEAHLHQAFELLLEAHYQSSPNDLALLLDDPNQWLLINYHGQQVIGVAWLALEGPLAEDLLDPVMHGKRRPKGNLLPQALGYFLQQRWAMAQQWCRVVRVAVAINCRRQRVGSQLLSQAKEWAQSRRCGFIGTSFGFESSLYAFWQQNNYQPLRISTAVDRVSARHPMLMGQRLCNQLETQWSELTAYGNAELQWLVADSSPIIADDSVMQDVLNGFISGRLSIASAQFSLSSQSVLPTNIKKLFRQSPLPLAELKQQLNVESRQQLTDVLRQQLG
ncbi:GNAT family N-acetyltransferase [Idiomarina seosinensis]|uniref:tRNA cytosine(34) acetyltransferase TmcA n=1 Tax=Idiomarina seosinensis TaxID=281739 RepID=A0A432Z4C3_9GAMM|nr:GNAT family N-acetyltransferase [Idiomarina seosinensis]RUO72752.1 tRNA cytosine(34) acetyltransferase TmcA [Idiomarina seosinensis]